MVLLKNLSSNKLNKMFEQTQAEIERRKKIELAQAEIQVVLDKYDISANDIQFVLQIKKSRPKTRVSKNSKVHCRKSDTSKAKADKRKKDSSKKISLKHEPEVKSSANRPDRRATVAPKYKNPHTGAKWSGRGRPPSWVNEVTRKLGITLDQFKSHPTYKV